MRDLLLGREPADYDVSTAATPEQVMRLFPEAYAVGAQFGVVLVPQPDATGEEKQRAFDGEGESAEHPAVVEVATFRSDVGYSDGRHPDKVLFTDDWRKDVERRDFTINGLMFDPETNEVLDAVGGQQDLKRGIIRTIGEPARRFAEDNLRMMRAVRFAARFGYQIEAGTMAAIGALRKQISQVSRERVREELTKMLTEGNARRAFELLDEFGLLGEVLPEVTKMKGVEQPEQFHPEGDVFVHTLLLLENLPHPCPATLAWGALLHDVGKPATFRVAPDRIRFDGHVEVGMKVAEELCHRLRFSNDDTAQIVELVKHHMRFGQVSRMKESTLKKFLRMSRFDEHLKLHWLDCRASHGDLSSYEYTREKLETMPPEVMRPAPLVTGDDLIERGYAPGPRFKEILGAVEDGQLEGRLQSREEALEFVQREFPR